MFHPLVLAILALICAIGSSNARKQHSCENKCITEEEVTHLIDGFRKVISESPVNKTSQPRSSQKTSSASPTASTSSTKSPSLNTTLTHSLPELLDQESRLPAVGTVKDLYVAHNCEMITWYFEFATKPLPTRGIAILFVNRKTRKIWKAYREANVGATLVAQGRPECKGDFGWSVGREGVEGGRSGCEGGCGVVEGY
ncbi:hypothetical protein M409DRAFT_16237 [Zasmidium cellare ATCC 36951]|uniref:NTF2-like domain-containing protein n=1 Tax=Zasmidium cellare ATCC 36951 TaxID=1080233 RepID=A0A6A6D6B2_ZASCE|nr:uncharacterized protein M409DRAFT_16237 [Zasmidium cellare ATCC 36951]KAF2173968.1 hypothetical protein M409DRAFT_16237 [Zasmidium cellare ATCC 36951]